MSFTPGTRLGPYEIQSAIGAGGMGEVYKAKDTRLGRVVAIKVLPAGVASDPDRRRRFEQEARAASALNHPHICALYDIGSQPPDGAGGAPIDYLVMEHLDGQTLAARLARGQLPVAQALEIGIQIADALSAAHKHGIVHRDLKPGNIMLVKGDSGGPGQVKLLDFGLAKLRAAGPTVDGSEVATVTAPATTPGMVVGTVPYMTPEQIEGTATDARTDLFAFGTVLYEMLTGTRAFAGDSSASVMAAILEREPPPLAALVPLTPPALDRVVRRCLAKDPDARWDSAHDVADELRWIRETGGAPAGTRSQPSRGLVLALMAAGAVTMAGVGAGVMWVTQRVQSTTGAPQVAHLALMLPSDAPLWTDVEGHAGLTPSFALSPDGSALAYSCVRGTTTQLCVRRFDRDMVSPIAGTEGARFPVFSPDGQAILFCTATRGTSCGTGDALKRVSIADGRVDAVGTLPAELQDPSSLDWAANGTVLLTGWGGVWQMPETGGAMTAVVRADHKGGEVGGFFLPSLLPDGQRVLFTVARFDQGRFVLEVRVAVLATGKQDVLLKDAGMAWYVPTGHLLYQQGSFSGPLVVAPFDPVTLTLGTPVPVELPVRRLDKFWALAFSRSGTLSYLPIDADRVLTWIDRERRTLPALAAKGPWNHLQLSPDGRRVAVQVHREQTRPGIEVVDLERGDVVQVAGSAEEPLWTSDGQRIVFNPLTYDTLQWQAADGSGTPEILHRVVDRRGNFNSGSWSPQGVLAFWRDSDRADPQEDLGIWTLTHEGAAWVLRRFLPLAGTKSPGGTSPRFSPDGRWMAYSSTESGAEEIWVRAYPQGDQRTKVSVGGGHDAVWSRDGRELFYRSGEGFYAVSLTLTPTFAVRGKPQLLFTGPFLDVRGAFAHTYDVTRDGQRFLVVQISDEERRPRRIHLVQHWFDELKAKVPTKQ